MSRWFRFYSEAMNDPKVDKLQPTLYKTWVKLLCLACQHPTGKLPSIDDVAYQLRLSVHDAQQQIDELILGGLIDISQSGMIPHNWSTRQYASDSSAERMKRLREKKKVTVTSLVTSPVTKHDAPEQNRTDSDTEPEQTTTSADEPAQTVVVVNVPVNLNLLQARIEEVAGPILARSSAGLQSMATPLMWLEQGCDLERDVVPGLKAVVANRLGKSKISDWNYFTQAIANAKAARNRHLPEATAANADSNRPAWAIAEDRKKKQFWDAMKAAPVKSPVQ